MKKYILVLIVFYGFSIQAKRLAPNIVKPIVNAGLRYEIPHLTSDNKNARQNGGYVRVVNVRNSITICTKMIYETRYDENMEHDVQDNFITSLKLEGKELVVYSEKLDPIRKPLENFCD